MATKQQRLPRILQGVLEALEQGNLKAVLKRSEALLEKHPSHVFGKVLRANALDLSDRRSEALDLIHEAKSSRIADPLVLGHIRDLFQRGGMYAEIIDFYTTAWEEDSSCEEVGVQLCLALASEMRFQRQQGVALQLLRKFARPQYLHWAVAAILLQAPPPGPHRSLDLAEALFQRTLAESMGQKPESTEVSAIRDRYYTFLLHLCTLRQQGKYSQAVSFLDASSNIIPLPTDALRLKALLLAEAREPAAVDAAKARFILDVRQWSAAREYVAAAYHAESFLLLEEEDGFSVNSDPLNGSLGVPQLLIGGDSQPFLEKVDSSASSAQSLNYKPHGHQSPPTTLVPPTTKAHHRGSVQSLIAGPAKGGDAFRVETLDFMSRTGGAAHRSMSSVNLESLDLDNIGSGNKVHEAYTLIRHFQQSVRDTAVRPRTVYLAEIEMRALAFAASELEAIERAMIQADAQDHRSWLSISSQEDLGDFTDSIASYFERHGNQGGCYNDIKPYLCILDENRIGGLLQKMQAGRPELEMVSPAPPGNDREAWERTCTDAHKRLTLARLRRGLKALVGLPLEQMAAEVNALLLHWDELRQLLGDEPGEPQLTKRGHGLPEEVKPSLDIDEHLCLIIANLLDMDRAHCVQVTTDAVTGYPGPGLRDRVYIMDALILLEVGIKYSPQCARLRLMLAMLYGAVGAIVPMRKWYDSLKPAHLQHEAWSHVILSHLVSLGWWEDVPEICGRLRQLHEQLELDVRAELANVCKEGGAQGVYRSREYMAFMNKMRQSITCGRIVVEEAITEVMKFSNVQTMLDYLNRHLEKLTEIKDRPLSSWLATETQSHSVFQSLHFIPRCTPLQAVTYGIFGLPQHSWVHRAAPTAPANFCTAFPQTPNDVVISSMASTWPAATAGRGEHAYEKLGLPPIGMSELSALEELVGPQRDAKPIALRRRALLLLLARLFLRALPSEIEAARLLHELQENLTSEGLATCRLAASIGSGVAPAPGAVSSPHPTGGVPSGGGGTSSVRSAGSRTSVIQKEAVKEGSSEASSFRRSNTNIDSEAKKQRSPSLKIAARSRTSGGAETSPLSEQRRVSEAPARHENRKPTPDTVSALSSRDQPPRQRSASRGTRGRHLAPSAAGEKPALSPSTVGGIGVEMMDLVMQPSKASLPPPWCPAPEGAEDAFWRCAFLACDAGHRCLQAMTSHMAVAEREDSGSSEMDTSKKSKTDDMEDDPEELLAELTAPTGEAAWDSLHRSLTVLTLLVRECSWWILQSQKLRGVVPGEQEPSQSGMAFRLGGHGVPLLSSFLTGPMLVIVPMVSFITSKLDQIKPPDLGRRHAIESRDDPGASSRAALGAFVRELLSVLQDFIRELVCAQFEGFDLFAGITTAPVPRISFFDENSIGGLDLEKTRRMVSNNLVTSHRKQLAALEQAVATKSELVKSLYERPSSPYR